VTVRTRSSLRDERAAHRSLDGQLAAARAQQEATDTQLVEARAAVDDGVKKLATATADNATLEGRAKDLDDKVQYLQSSLERANSQVSSAQKERDTARDQVLDANCRLVNVGFELLGFAEFRKTLTAAQIDQISRSHTVCAANGHGGDLTGSGSVGA